MPARQIADQMLRYIKGNKMPIQQSLPRSSWFPRTRVIRVGYLTLRANKAHTVSKLHTQFIKMQIRSEICCAQPASSTVNKVANEHIIAKIDISCAMIGRACSQFPEQSVRSPLTGKANTLKSEITVCREKLFQICELTMDVTCSAKHTHAQHCVQLMRCLTYQKPCTAQEY